MSTFTPREVVSELDRFIVGQHAAKRAVAIALRNRWRRQQVRGELRDEIHPKNILMIGPTGVGKTEIARRLAKLAAAPFVKVEASKFTEVGYVGRDVEAIVRDLVEVGVKLVRDEEVARVRASAERIAEERLLDALYPRGPGASGTPDGTRERMREKLRDGSLEEREVELELSERQAPVFEILAPGGVEDVGGAFKDLMSGFLPKKTRTRRLKVAQARELLRDEEAGRMIDAELVREKAVARVEQSGIVFIDEIDKIARRESQAGGPDVSREGVQRDLLPIVEGTSVQTKHGHVRTDHVLFIAAGAFHVSRPSDLIPELQGRFPIRVELEDLDEAAFVRILEEPHNALVKQYQALLATEGVTLEFKPDAVREIARIAALVNRSTENIGARRLHTVLERLLDETLFDAPDLGGRTVVFDAARVAEKLADIAGDRELSRFIL